MLGLFPAPGLSSNETVSVPHCSFFNNRAPRPVPNLKNCTWYRDRSCCLQQEIDTTFGQVKPLRGATPECQLWLNYLICYICSPDQASFYRRERLTVCEEVCDGFLSACGDAEADGKRIKETYRTGRQFCEGRSFSVKKRSTGQCFHFDLTRHKRAEKSRQIASAAPDPHGLPKAVSVTLMLWTTLVIIGITFGSNLAVVSMFLYSDVMLLHELSH